MCLAVSLHVAFTVAAAKSCGCFSDSVVIQYGLELVLSRAEASVSMTSMRTQKHTRKDWQIFVVVRNRLNHQWCCPSFESTGLVAARCGLRLMEALQGKGKVRRVDWVGVRSISLCDFCDGFGGYCFYSPWCVQEKLLSALLMISKNIQLSVTKMVLIFTIAHIIAHGSSCQQGSPMQGRGNQRCSAMLGPRLPERVHVGACRCKWNCFNGLWLSGCLVKILFHKVPCWWCAPFIWDIYQTNFIIAPSTEGKPLCWSELIVCSASFRQEWSYEWTFKLAQVRPRQHGHIRRPIWSILWLFYGTLAARNHESTN